MIASHPKNSFRVYYDECLYNFDNQTQQALAELKGMIDNYQDKAIFTG
jgi:hypothetical protein